MASRTCRIILFAVNLVRMIAAVIFTVATVFVTDALEVLASELHWRAGFVLTIAELALIRSITAIIVMITHPTLEIHSI